MLKKQIVTYIAQFMADQLGVLFLFCLCLASLLFVGCLSPIRFGTPDAAADNDLATLLNEQIRKG